jgi:hypothetical protein
LSVNGLSRSGLPVACLTVTGFSGGSSCSEGFIAVLETVVDPFQELFQFLAIGLRGPFVLQFHRFFETPNQAFQNLAFMKRQFAIHAFCPA